MKRFLEDVNDCIRESLPILIFISWLLIVVIIVRGLYAGWIR